MFHLCHDQVLIPVDEMGIECKILLFLLVDILNLFQYRKGGTETGKERGMARGNKRLFDLFPSTCHEIHITLPQFFAHSH